MGMSVILTMLPGPFIQSSVPLSRNALAGHVVSDEKSFKNCLQTTDGRTPKHGYTISSPFEQDVSDELNRNRQFAFLFYEKDAA